MPSGLDRATSLCLACSSSLPPRRTISKATEAGFDLDDEIFLTLCCRRPICPTCIRRNPRLARYNPCLHCLGGVGAVSAGKTRASTAGDDQNARVNVDGAVRDDDVFVLGDDGPDDFEDDSESSASDSLLPDTPPPAYADIPRSAVLPCDAGLGDKPDTSNPAEPEERRVPDSSGSACPPAPKRYYIKPDDTLLGIALRFGVDGRLLCRLNGLSSSAISTTPHLLHTRTFLVLPSSARGAALANGSSVYPHSEDARHAGRRVCERAEKRLQILTKEVDWRIAKAYVAVADVNEDEEDVQMKSTSFEGTFGKARETLRKRRGIPSGAEAGPSVEGSLEERAVDRYLDDEEWEEREKRAGRGVAIPSFPYLRNVFHKDEVNPSLTAWWKWQR